MLELGYAFLSSLTLPEVAEPHLERLVAEVHESSSVSVLDGDDIVYVARVPTSRIMRVSINVGTRFPAYATSMGRVLLAGMDPTELDAFLERAELRRAVQRARSPPSAKLRAELDRVRGQGWAIVDQELEEGLRSVAAPIRDRTGRVVAAVNLSAHASRTSTDAMKRDAAAAAARDGRADRGRAARGLGELAAAVGGMTAPAGAVRPQAAAPGGAERAGAALVAAVVLLAINLRSVLAGLPPLIADVRADLGLSAAAAGVLTTLPVLCMGAFAPIAPRLAARVPMERALVACALLTAAGHRASARSGRPASLFAAGLAIGVAIALAQALLPVLIRTRYRARLGPAHGRVLDGARARLGARRGRRRAARALRSAAGSGRSPSGRCPRCVGRARLAAGRAAARARPCARGGGAPLRGSGLAWAVSGFFGIQSMAFYASLSWIPSILEDGGWSSEAAGGLLAFGALCGLLPAFLVPVLAARAPDQMRLLLAIVLVPAAGLAGVLALPGLAPLWMVLIGFGQSGALGLALALPIQRGGDAPTVASLTAMALCVGYLVAATGPWLLGAVHDASGDWTVPLIVLIAITLAELRARRARGARAYDRAGEG